MIGTVGPKISLIFIRKVPKYLSLLGLIVRTRKGGPAYKLRISTDEEFWNAPIFQAREILLKHLSKTEKNIYEYMSTNVKWYSLKDIMEYLKVPQPTTSLHLNKLTTLGLVEKTYSRNVVYRVIE